MFFLLFGYYCCMFLGYMPVHNCYNAEAYSEDGYFRQNAQQFSTAIYFGEKRYLRSLTVFWIHLWNMPILFLLFRISLSRWYGLKAWRFSNNTRESLFIVELYKNIPSASILSLFLKMLETCFFFDLLLTFNVRGQGAKSQKCFMFKSVCLKIFGLKLLQLDCMII